MTFCPSAVASDQHSSSVGLTHAPTLPPAPPLLLSALLVPGHFISTAPNHPPIATTPMPSLKAVYNPMQRNGNVVLSCLPCMSSLFYQCSQIHQ